jgi:hypothetical protein
MAVGAAVILCDFSGAGPMVTTAEFDELRPLNFGFEALREPLQPEHLLREIARYDAVDAARVRDRIRLDAGLVTAVEELLAIYRDAIAERPVRRQRSLPDLRQVPQRLLLDLHWRWIRQPPGRRNWIRAIPGVRRIVGRARRMLDGAS